MSALETLTHKSSSEEEKSSKFSFLGLKGRAKWGILAIAGFGIVAGAFFSNQLFLSAPASSF